MATLLEMRAITKEFPGVKALDRVSLSVEAGEIHALVGENGAGKSTLMKVLSGVYPHGSYTGDIAYDGKVQSFANIRDSEAQGIIIIHQELALVPLLSVAENIYLGNERATRGIMDWRATRAGAAKLLARVGLKEHPDTLVDALGLGKQQLVEIAKALSKDVRLLILDEPTSSLNETDSAKLLDLLLEFKAQGVTSILISHKLNEISKVADTITVIRDGAAVSRLDCRTGISEGDIIRDMVGRSLDDRYPPKVATATKEVAMQVRNWCVAHPLHSDRQVVKDVSFDVKKGEVIGIAGLMGAGRTELAMSLFGRSYGAGITGSAQIGGRDVDLSTVRRAIDAGLAYATEDRKTYGLVLDDTIRRNVPLANLPGVSNGMVVDKVREAEVATQYRTRLKIKSSSIEQETVNLSGGNQQKVVLSKWLFSDPDVLILDEPTRGIDVGAKYEIYTVIRDLAASGKAIIVISSEMPELLGITDRIYVMNEGRFVGEMPTRDASQEKIMATIIRSGDRT
ncbi:multiple monosaccharide ABC transporter ATP-binding protein [Loktanella sp. M215]|uniref:multiple monosaccharide ABC transporter ATP-binding protein n=1 Tax=Loktanella sp. M215 TaxID=2675431 RepID=UPI001F8E088A|nr:multiple monosaccharide ABC transporter ATP-binding protein [Loktanella sp. M215]MCF7701225.1 ATP-binding cassette domain-containing protein [Loktanella sp. M215]